MSHLEDALPEVELYGLGELTTKLQEDGGRAVAARASLAIAYLGGLHSIRRAGKKLLPSSVWMSVKCQ